MANEPPKTQSTPEPQPAPTLIPVALLTFTTPTKHPVPGKRGVHPAIKATAPSKSEFWSITFDPKLRHHVVAHFAPGPDLRRPPSATRYYPETVGTWERA